MSDSSKSTAGGGGCLGAVVASALSYWMWHSVGWAILHFFFGWLYVIYFVLHYGIAPYGIAPLFP